jgi:hypothetical protein
MPAESYHLGMYGLSKIIIDNGILGCAPFAPFVSLSLLQLWISAIDAIFSFIRICVLITSARWANKSVHWDSPLYQRFIVSQPFSQVAMITFPASPSM